MSLHPIKRTRSTSLASLPQEATKNIEVQCIQNKWQPKRKGYRLQQRQIDFTRTSEEG